MRGRSWRRHIEELVVKKRLRNYINHSGGWWKFYNINDSKTTHPMITDILGTKDHFNSKTIKTDKWRSKNKVKYSPNKNKPYFRDGVKKFACREFNKIYFRKILKENGII